MLTRVLTKPVILCLWEIFPHSNLVGPCSNMLIVEWSHCAYDLMAAVRAQPHVGSGSVIVEYRGGASHIRVGVGVQLWSCSLSREHNT